MTKYVTVPSPNSTVPEGKVVINNSGNANININIGK
jgi:hypothetical protein